MKVSLVALAAIGSAVAIALAGCASPSPTLGSPAETPPAPSIEPSAAGEGGGDFIRTDGSPAGRIAIVIRGDTLEAALVDWVTGSEGELNLVLSPTPINADQRCFDTGWRPTFGPITSEKTYVLGDLQGSLGNDPSFLDAAVVTRAPADRSLGCLAEIVAVADLTWKVSDPRPELRVVDLGTSARANGDVEVTDDGPASYTVAGDDTIESVAARFGIPVEDLYFLNPARTPNPRDPILYVGEVLNLSKAGR